MALFRTPDNRFDEPEFKTVRNLLGMVLLLKDSQNLSSQNEVYRDKVETYKKSNFIWNELLVGHLHSVDLRNLPDLLRVKKVDPDDTGAFPKDEVFKRQELISNAIKYIWFDS